MKEGNRTLRRKALALHLLTIHTGRSRLTWVHLWNLVRAWGHWKSRKIMVCRNPYLKDNYWSKMQGKRVTESTTLSVMRIKRPWILLWKCNKNYYNPWEKALQNSSNNQLTLQHLCSAARNQSAMLCINLCTCHQPRPMMIRMKWCMTTHKSFLEL